MWAEARYFTAFEAISKFKVVIMCAQKRQRGVVAEEQTSSRIVSLAGCAASRPPTSALLHAKNPVALAIFNFDVASLHEHV
jgi:hypothetical protein